MSRPRANTSRQPLQSGFSLIEVMITLFVVAVGLLSVAGLQTLSKKSNFDAVQRTVASALAQDLIERMRSNPAQGAAYVTDATVGISALPAAPSVNCTTSTGSSAACTPAEVATFDRYQWSRALFGQVESVKTGSGASATTDYTGGLSEPTACIVNAQAPCGVYTITITWRGITPLPKAYSDEAGTAVNSSCGIDNENYKPSDGSSATKTLRRLIVLQTVIDDHNGSCISSAAAGSGV